MSDKVVKLIEDVKALTVLELSELVKALEEEFGVSAAAPVAVAAAPAGAAAAPAADFAGNRHLAGCSGSRGARRDGFGVFSRQGTEKVSVLRERVLLREQHSFVIYR